MDLDNIYMKSIQIYVNNRDIFFRRYVEILNSVLGLRQRELDVLMMLIDYYDLHWCDMVDRIVFSSDIKKEICNRLGISDSILNNCLSSLRSSGIIVGRSVLRKYLIRYNDSVNINFQICHRRK